MTRDEAADILIEALGLARERVTADTVDGKREKRDRLRNAVSGLWTGRDAGQGGPSGADLRELLGDPDDKRLRQAISAWDAA